MPLTSNKDLKVDIADDRLTAVLSLNTGVSPQSVETGIILDEIDNLGIQVDEEGKKSIDEFIQALSENVIPETVVVARGTPPENDSNGYIEKLYEVKTDELKVNTKNFYDQSHIITVENNQEILRIVPPVTGKDGQDVLGQKILRKLGREAQIKLGLNVERKGDLIIATSAGKLDFTNNKASVFPKLEIPGNVDFSVGNIDFSGEILIHKNVLDLFKVKSSSTIAVQGLVEAAEVTAGEDLIITGGITGKEKGIISAGKNLATKYITNATVCAGGNITVRTEIVNCEVTCDGSITVENGPLVGGYVIAKGGIHVKQLGSEAGVKTLLDVGFNAALKQKCLELAPEIQLRRQKAAKVKQAVEPLLRNQKQLNSEQKEKATELLYQACELEDGVKEMVRQIQKLYDETIESAIQEVVVTGTIYNGVIIRFPRVQAIITEPLIGPLKIVPKEIHGLWRVLAIDSNTSSEHELKSGDNTDEFWRILHKIIHPAKQTYD
jgi:hypothetical protein